MKVLCVTPHYWPALQYGGTVAAVHSLNNALAKRGADIAVYTTNVGVEGKVPVNQEINIEGIKVTYFTFTKLWDFIGTIGWQFSRQISRALKDNLKNFELIYIVNIWSYPAAVAAHYSRIYGKPYIVVPSGMLYPHTFSKKIWKKWPYYHFVAKRILRGASLIHYTTEDEAEKTHSFLHLKNEKIVIANGIDLSQFCGPFDRERFRGHYPKLKDKKVILFLGRIHWIKGMDILTAAYAKIAKERDDVHLFIVGNGSTRYTRKVKEWLKDYGLSDKSTFTGMLTGREKLEACYSSDVFVLPSYSENFGMAAVEAMALGIPVILSDKVGIYKQVQCHKAGMVINPDTQSLYQAIRLLLEDSNLRKEIANNGRKLVEEYYDIEKVADKMIASFSNLQDRYD